ncbi:RNA-guided endonuclease InsQ/TnpB family protein [Adlercreutzia equolifaciens]|nr:RNA-guided endonuclease TnpB family protein [Adlercreutzia equolifaciens]
MNRSFKYRIYPTAQQALLIAKTFGCCRKIWNLMLDDKLQEYRAGRKMSRQTPAQYKKDYPYLKEVDSMALINVQLHLEEAFRSYFQQPRKGLPRHKTRKRSSRRYTTNLIKNNIEIGRNWIKLPKMGKVRAKIHRALPLGAHIKSVTVSQDRCGDYYAGVLVEIDPLKTKQNTDRLGAIESTASIGLDYSMPSFFVSTSFPASHPRPMKKNQERLARAQKSLSRKRRGSANYRRQQKKVARIYRKIADQRRDYIHKASREITNRFDVIGIEDINMVAMSRVLHFGSAVFDNGWSLFVHCLTYKAEEQGGTVTKVGRSYPSTKRCSQCGIVNQEIRLGDRSWTCPNCGAFHDRDKNAAENIRQEAVRIMMSRQPQGMRG